MMVDWKCSEEHFEIVHIPDKPRIPPHLQPTVDVYASFIDPEHAHTLIRKLNQIAPLENLRHVKRVRRNRLEGGKIQLSAILCLACGNDCHLDGIPNAVLELITMYQLIGEANGKLGQVCKYAASSREEWEEQCKLWPTSYHPPTYNIDGITGFSDEDSQSVLTFMKSAIDLAKSGDGEVVNAAIIVDPSTNQVIASAVDQMLSWNTSINKICVETSCIEKPEATSFHSITNGVEDHGNLLLNCSLNGPKRISSSVSCLHPWQWPKLQSCTSSSPWHPLRHAAIVAIELSAARDLRLFPRSGNTGIKFDQADYMECPLTGSSPLKRQKTNAAIADEDVKLNCQNGCHPESGRPYLCTGFDIYLVWEPCTMCAMALVHQRVKRIFYAFPNSFAGALGSVHRLQGEKGLNHHYAVFRVVLPEVGLGDG
ncbi:hypothetical protein RJ639_022425 [Escallonia herrerae]|uniref:CMP/dCMP-type deaminase domain-containing protein n=1 Tax=Escallonia herrerae TaxID=1293975 RepID=A0AA88V2I7_9ASTE|nr:hypothetical protein RJ639_022425 [Escallonia herrerae]